MIKIIFFDIDGTLIDYGTNGITRPVTQALRILQKKGIKLFLATGRPNIFIPTFSNIAFDGVLSFNGSFCFDQEQVIYKNPLPKNEVMQLVHNAHTIRKAVAMANTKYVASNYAQPDLEKYFTIASQTLPVADDFNAFYNDDIYECMVAIEKNQNEALLQGLNHLKLVRWVDWAVDIIPEDGGKDKGIEQILAHYGLDPSECMAFGDGQNDADMLKYAHIGVAMENAMDETKALADYVTKDVKEDGIIHALKHFHLL